MTYWFLVTLLLTIHGIPAADIPRPFTSEEDCNVAGFVRASEIAADKSLASGVWTCASVDFTQSDPEPLPSESKHEG